MPTEYSKLEREVTDVEEKPRDITRTGFFHALGRLLLFQFRLAADALRDLLMSPLSVAAFLLDAVFQPARKDSFYQKLMVLGRHTDRWINLFEEFSDAPVDSEIETCAHKEFVDDQPSDRMVTPSLDD